MHNKRRPPHMMTSVQHVRIDYIHLFSFIGLAESVIDKITVTSLPPREGCKLLWWVCLSVRSHNFTNLFVHVACGSVLHWRIAICYVLPVLWMTSCFHIMAVPSSRQITKPAPRHSIFTGRMLFLTSNQQRQSTEGTYTCNLYLIFILILYHNTMLN